MMLRDFQKLLGTVYRIEQTWDVYDFLVTDSTVLNQWEISNNHNVEEKLLIRQDESELGLALYLDSSLLERLQCSDPRQYLGRSNLADFCTVLEGVSHFNYLVWNAEIDKCVTLMELELQAEIDKYVGARILLESQQRSSRELPLLQRLFEHVSYHSHLGAEELQRYRSASCFAGRYCRNLEARFPDGRIGDELLRELRAFYRLTQPAKVSHIQTTHFDCPAVA